MSPPLITDISAFASLVSSQSPLIIFYYNKPTQNAKFCNNEKAKAFTDLARINNIFTRLWINKAYGDETEYDEKKEFLMKNYRVTDNMGILIFKDGKKVGNVVAIDSEHDKKLAQFKKILNKCKESKSSESPKQATKVPKPAPKGAKTPSVKERAPSVKSAKAPSVKKLGTPTKDDAPVDCCTIL